MLDTSTVILLGQIFDPSELPDESVISAITLAELSVGPHVARDDTERGARQQHLQQAESDFDVLPFDGDCARAFGAVAAALRTAGRKPQRGRTTHSLRRARSHMRCRSTHAIQPTSRESRDLTSGRSPIPITSIEDATRLLGADNAVPCW